MKNYILIVTLFVLSCNKNIHKPFDVFEENENDIVLKNNIKEIKEIEIGLDTAGISLWKRTSSIKQYNKDGNLIMSIAPIYISNPWPEPKPGGMKIEEMEYYLTKSQTNIPSGKVDTTLYNYDNQQNLISIKNEFLTTFKYDSFNNQIERCISSNLSETSCYYSKYKYDEKGQIIFKIDSIGMISNAIGHKNQRPKKVFYKYDDFGRIITNGEYIRKFDSKGRLKEVEDLLRGDKYFFEYDNEGKRVSETYVKLTSSIFDEKRNISIPIETKTFRTFFYYNEKGLLREKKQVDENNKLVALTNFEYLFY